MTEEYLQGRIIEWSYRSNSGLIVETATSRFGDAWFRFKGYHIETDYFESRSVARGDDVWFTWAHGANGRYQATGVVLNTGHALDNPNYVRDSFGILLDHRHLDDIGRHYASSGVESICWIRADLDNFKRVNDHGHQAGDELLKEVFRNVRAVALKRGCVPIRAGGDELVVVDSNGDPTGALMLGEAVRKAVADSTVEYDDQTLSITASVGVATHPPTKVQDLDRTADEFAVHAKDTGKNRVVSYPE